MMAGSFHCSERSELVDCDSLATLLTKRGSGKCMDFMPFLPETEKSRNTSLPAPPDNSIYCINTRLITSSDELYCVNGSVRNARVRITALHRQLVEVRIPQTGEVQFTELDSQRSTPSCVVLDLRTDAFAHSQLYTALSRVRNCDDIPALFSGKNEERETENIIYFSLLLQNNPRG
ncbi:uncharacterized protein F5147DRAFT_91441 [Suillus discolor]|uniref:Uncharacterized protein n=1 Tax=Suillus discolor TaxID=1912936 RepID=A0A9P7FBB0_9AGAM|nr:uncharacterized protein F5147DRAFT_91441 [Suillus discolor]KAG2111564.1 hypothetical protein F5147DRAFT_91441 [Suillus discolor]